MREEPIHSGQVREELLEISDEALGHVAGGEGAGLDPWGGRNG